MTSKSTNSSMLIFSVVGLSNVFFFFVKNKNFVVNDGVLKGETFANVLQY